VSAASRRSSYDAGASSSSSAMGASYSRARVLREHGGRRDPPSVASRGLED
jgi:hypothetical protein